MKIALIGSSNTDSMEYHVKDALEFAGHKVVTFDICNNLFLRNKILKPYFLAIDKTLRIYNDSYDKMRCSSITSTINDFNPDLVMCFYRDIHPSFVESIKNCHRKVVHINPDQMTTLGYQQVLASNYDAWFTKDPYMFRLMIKNLNLNAFEYKEAFNQRFNPKPNIGKEEAEQEIGIDVMTYGTLYPYRNRMLKQVINSGVDLKLFGVTPHRFFDKELSIYCTGRYIVGKEKAEMIYGSKIVLNNLHFAEIESVNCRFFEINGCGGFQLCDYRSILHDLLPIDPELVSFKSMPECIDKLNYYINHQKERFEISQTVYKHFIENYTYDHLVKYILEIISKL